MSQPVNNQEGILTPRVLSAHKSKITTAILIALTVLGATSALLGVLHFLPAQWAHFQTASISYMTPAQLSLNSLAFTGIILGTIGVAAGTLGLANLLKNQITKRTQKESSPSMNKAYMYTALSALIIAVAMITVASIAYSNVIANNHLLLPSGESAIAVSLIQMKMLTGFGIGAGASAGIGMFALSKWIHALLRSRNQTSVEPATTPFLQL